jgi:hypothetical protein
MKDSCDVGDMGLIYPDFEYFSNKPAFTHPVNKTWHTLKYEDVFKVYSELKISYLGIKGSYTLRNLRKYQNLDYYIFTLVDCSDRFNYKIVALSHKDLYDRSGLTFSYMNGTKKQNETNTNVGVGSSFKKGSYLEENILSLNRMGGYSFDDLIEFIGKEDEKLKNDFIKRWDDKPLSNKW